MDFCAEINFLSCSYLWYNNLTKWGAKSKISTISEDIESSKSRADALYRRRSRPCAFGALILWYNKTKKRGL